jgi:translation initiation factor 5A
MQSHVSSKKYELRKNETTAVEEEIKDRIAQGEVQGRDVEYWKVLDRIKIVRIKG